MKELELNDVGQFIGNRIKSIAKVTEGHFGHDVLRVQFVNGESLVFHDEAQTCCEQRYMEIQSDLEYFEGAMFLDAKLGDCENVIIQEGDEQDIQFLNIFTSKGVVVVCNYNLHNGYYGGFFIRVIHEKEGDNEQCSG